MFKEEFQLLAQPNKENPQFFFVGPKKLGIAEIPLLESIKLRIFPIFFKKLRVQPSVFEVLYVRYGITVFYL